MGDNGAILYHVRRPVDHNADENMDTGQIGGRFMGRLRKLMSRVLSLPSAHSHGGDHQWVVSEFLKFARDILNMMG